VRFLAIIFISFFLLNGCSKRDETGVFEQVIEINAGQETETHVNENLVIVDPLRVRAAEITSSLSDRLLTAQIFICGFDGRGSIPGYMKTLLENTPPGGVMLFRNNLNTDNRSIRTLINEASSLIADKSSIAPFVAVDHEGESVNRFNRGVADLPRASFYWDFFLTGAPGAATSRIEEDSFKAAVIINGLGINMNFAPVAEHLTDNNRHFLNDRSYGPSPVFTSLAASAFVRGMERSGVMCVIKHFPGSAGLDPHYSPSIISADKKELDMIVSPFYSLILSGARAVMVSHTHVPAVDNRIASLSPVVMRNWLREELGFNGIIIADDFYMASAGGMNPDDAAILSIASGADMVLVWQMTMRHTHNEFMTALERGILPRERLIESVQRIIYEKLRMGLIE